MSPIISWQDPPRDYRDDCEEIAAALRARPGEWALILEQSEWVDAYGRELAMHGIRVRRQNVRTRVFDMREWDEGDLYARAELDGGDGHGSTSGEGR